MAIYGYTLTSSLSRIKGCGVVMMMVVVVLQQHDEATRGSEKYVDGDEKITVQKIRTNATGQQGFARVAGSIVKVLEMIGPISRHQVGFLFARV